MRIKTKSYYVRAEYPGTSGFKDWTRKVESVVTGHKARNNRLSIVREYLATGIGKFRLCDGHLPDHQPIVSEVEMLRWLDANPYQEAVAVAEGPITQREHACPQCRQITTTDYGPCPDCLNQMQAESVI